jgi:hypothetical protein
MVKYINMTPHDVVLYAKEGEDIVFSLPKSENPLRVDSEQLEDGTATVTTRFKKPILPEKVEGVELIVSLPLLLMVRASGVFRDDLICPDTNTKAVRDKNGRIMGVRGFMRLAE